MCMDTTDVYNRLSPALTKIETLSALSPMCETDQETARTLGLLLGMIQDYAQALRHAIDNLPRGEGRQ